MKVSTLALVLALESAAAFSILPSKTITRTPTILLKYSIVYPEDDEKPKQGVDPNSVAYAADKNKSKEAPVSKSDPGPGSLDGYKDFNELDGDDEINVDSYSTEVGMILPGFHLSSLCTDD
jgi:hypothetical protein